MFGESLGVSSTDGRAVPGIYFLWSGNRVVYVGQAQKSALSRAADHCCEKEFDRSTFIPFHPEDLSFAESYYIWFLNPPLNRQVPVLGKQWAQHGCDVQQETLEVVCAFLRDLPSDFVASRFRDAEVRAHLWQGSEESLNQIRRLNCRVEKLVFGRKRCKQTAASR